MKKILILMFFSLLITPYVLAEESIPKLDIVVVDYPKMPWMGQELSLIITLDYDLITPAYGFIIVAQLETDRGTFEGLQMDKMWDEHKPSELPSTHIGRTWKTAGRKGYENFTLQFPIPPYIFGEAVIVLDTYSVVWDKDRTSKPCNIDKLCFTKEIPITVNPQEDEEEWGLVVNGGFELGALGWRIVGHNMTVKVDTNIGHSGNGLVVAQLEHTESTPLSSGVMQTINKPITPDLDFAFKTKTFMPISATGQNQTFERADKIITPGTLTQISIQFGNTHRINYIITVNPDDIYYRKKLENEANIVVAKPTSDWQLINRNVTNDFYQNFGVLKNFNNVSIIIEQASITSTPPNTNFDDVSLYELVSDNGTAPTPTPTTTPTIESTPTESTTSADGDITIAPETASPEVQENKIQIPSLSLPLILVAIIICILVIVIVTMRGKKKSDNIYCINCGKGISKRSSICPHCKSKQN